MGNKRNIVFTLAAICAILAISSSANAAGIWVGTTGDWGTASNWDAGVPGNATALTFDDAGITKTVSLGAGRTVYSMAFNSSSDYTLSGYTITANNGSFFTQSGSGAVTIGSNLTLGSTVCTFAGTGTGALTVNGSTSISDGGGATFNMAGNAVFNGATTFGSTTNTQIGAGAVIFNGVSNLGDNDTVIFAGTGNGGVYFNGGFTNASESVLSMNSASYTMSISGNNTVGTVRVATGATIDIVTGTLTTNGLGNSSSYGGTVTSSNSGTLLINNNANYTHYAALTGNLNVARLASTGAYYYISSASTTNGTLTFGRDGSVAGAGNYLQGADGAFTNISALTLYQKSVLTLENSTDNNNNRLSNTGTVNLNGGRLYLSANAGGTTETVGNVVVGSGLGALHTSSSSGTINAGAITHTTGGVLAFIGAGTVTTTSSNVNDILGGWAVYTSGTGIGNTWATVSGGGTITGLSSYSTDSNFSDGTLNKDMTSSQSPAGTVTVNSLRFNNSGSTLTIGSGQTATLNSGGVLVTSSAGTSGTFISGGYLTSGTSDLVFIFQGSNPAERVMTVDSVITGNIGLTKAGAGTLVLSSANTYTGETYVVTNDLTSAITGRLRVANNNALGTTAGGTTVYDGAALELYGGVTITGESLAMSGNGAGSDTGALYSSNGDNTWTGNINILNLGTNRIGVASGSTLTLSGVISGYDSGCNLIKTRSSSGDLTGDLILSGTNTYTGYTTIEAGNLIVGSNAPSGAAGALGISTSVVTVGTSSESANVGLLVNGAYTIGRNLTVTANSNAGVITLGGTNTSGTGTFTGNVAMNKAITLTAAAGGQVDFTGVINDGSGSYGLTKIGDGTVRLAAANTYDGVTAVNAGILLVDNNNALGTGAATVNGGILRIASGRTVSKNVTVNNGGNFSVNGTYSGGTLTLNSGATLSGSGTIGVAVTAGNGVTIAPGNSPGVATYTAGLDFASGSTYQWELIGNTVDIGTSPNYNFDQIVVSGGDMNIASGATLALTFASAGSGVVFSDVFWSLASGTHSWTIIDFTSGGTSADVFDTITSDTSYAGYGSFALANVGGDVVLTWTPVPEPGTLVLLAMGGVAVLLRKRRKMAA